MDFVDAYQTAIRSTAGLKILGEPDLSIVSFGSDELDIFRVAELMGEKGWLAGLTQKPKGIHRMMSMFHEPMLDEYLDDLRAAIGVVRQAPPDTGCHSGDVLSQPTEERASHFIIAWASARSACRAGSRE